LYEFIKVKFEQKGEMMKGNKLMILSSDAEAYLQIINRAALPDLSIKISLGVEQNNRYLHECDILLGPPDLVSKVLSHTHRMQWVQSTWAGITPLMEPGMRRDYLLTGVKGVFGPIMSEYVICHLLMNERISLERYQNQLKRKWDTTPPGTLRGKCIGVMGLGSIGREIADMAKAFGMRTRGFSRSRTSCESIERCFLPDELIPFVGGLDYLVCVLPDTADTCGLINDSVFQSMRKTAVIINVGRGNIFHEPSLIRALENGEIGGAVLDVFPEEPLPATHPLWETPNTIITSHTAAMSFPELVAPIFIENYRRFIGRSKLKYVIDFEHGY
jgi:phosphoglycerate dehydrogenase-like enzyme